MKISQKVLQLCELTCKAVQTGTVGIVWGFPHAWALGSLGMTIVVVAGTGILTLVNDSSNLSQIRTVWNPDLGIQGIATIWGIQMGDMSTMSTSEIAAIVQHEEWHMRSIHARTLGFSLMFWWLIRQIDRMPKMVGWKRLVHSYVLLFPILALSAWFVRADELNADHSVDANLKPALCTALDKLYRDHRGDVKDDWSHGGTDRLPAIGCIDSIHGEE